MQHPDKLAQTGAAWRLEMKKLGPLIGFILLCIVLSLLSDHFLTVDNWLNIFRQVSINALIAFGMTFVILTGGIDLSVGSVLALSSALAAGLMVDGVNGTVAIAVGIAAGLVMGALNGIIITKGRVAPFIATLATMTVFRGATLVYTEGRPITGFSDQLSFQMLGRGYFLGIPVPIILMLVIYAALYFVLKKTTFGRHTYAVGGNEEATRISGIRVDRLKIWIYSLTGGLSALAGLILTSRLNSAQPTAGTSYELDAIAAVVLGGTSLSGGRGWIFGTLIGALIIGVLNNGLNLLNVSSFYQQLIKGAVILLAVILDRRKEV
ncbi:branched-chain amino acid transport system / permease component family protein [Anoxybacillus sp. B7M1]|jgi:ribose transport system permease protein|uniref:Ribose ABC transporter permease n=2 Tax=Anoxybacillaceae TaxID=3120669 RepID=A0ABD5IZ29_9BACL|nr:MULTISPECIES: ribose ABC transporter permease [Anoxybacillus]ANB63028.1 branched-chain amino acid transport system / permease component family protein [Anoxybacillus sp. B7M1]ANB58754.1 branched-chain amino acid transport system / permease component family protein [Anoxybacillus sp. B2M1]KXG08461.1 Ribose transport system permease protein RbsC [Anoxybacillus sp. P3H1B]MBB3908356.1 ribose transport system permease protein [Anoxybacillus rupiensis]MED5053098.1 ribose ABC transporter permease 